MLHDRRARQWRSSSFRWTPDFETAQKANMEGLARRARRIGLSVEALLDGRQRARLNDRQALPNQSFGIGSQCSRGVRKRKAALSIGAERHGITINERAIVRMPQANVHMGVEANWRRNRCARKIGTALRQIAAQPRQLFATHTVDPLVRTPHRHHQTRPTRQVLQNEKAALALPTQHPAIRIRQWDAQALAR